MKACCIPWLLLFQDRTSAGLVENAYDRQGVCMQEVQAILVPAVQKFSQSRPYEANSYLTRVQADAACSHADALTAQVDSLHQSMSQVSFVMKESQGRLHVDDPMED